MFCSYCGKELGENAAVCLGCGASVKRNVLKKEGPLAAPSVWVPQLVSIVAFALAIMTYALCLTRFDRTAGLIFTCIFAVISLATGIVSTVYCLKDRRDDRFVSFLALSLSSCITVFAIIAVIFLA